MYLKIRGWSIFSCHSIIVTLISLVFLLAVLVGQWVYRDSQRGWTVNRLERAIANELPPDSGRSEIDDWFDRHGIAHDCTTKTTGDRSGQSTMPMLAGLSDNDLGGMVRGHIEGPDANVGFGTNGRITVYFFLDKNGRCVRHLVFPFEYDL